jgi:hypothetical protein
VLPRAAGQAQHGSAEHFTDHGNSAAAPQVRVRHAWSGGGIRSTVQDVANFYCALFTFKLLPKAEVATMENTTATRGAYGPRKWRMPAPRATRSLASVSRNRLRAWITTS